MKTLHFITVAIILTLLLLGGTAVTASAKDGSGYTEISGVVKDRQTKKKLGYVNVSIPGTSIGTITNADGGFSIKVTDSIQAEALEISHVGYFNQRLPIKRHDMHDVTVFLMPNAVNLQEVVIRGANPIKLVTEAIQKIKVNNSANPNMLTGFYRETIKKRRSYINISEAVINIYKTPYTENINLDRIQIHKGRRLLSPKAGDTLVVKLAGGPNLSIFLDFVKNRDMMLDIETLHYYRFWMDKSVMINERPHFVVGFEPQVTMPYPLFNGKLYIDQESLAFSQAEFSFSMEDRNKVTQAVLKKKPFNLRFKPEEITYLVTYKQHNGRSYLNYIRSEFNFKCDWKRRLFSTNYSVLSEMVVTNIKEKGVAVIPYKLAFHERNSLSDKVSNFYDENFWEDYNIIEPTESLENAVNKLKKKW